jgi:hypothetical protein
VVNHGAAPPAAPVTDAEAADIDYPVLDPITDIENYSPEPGQMLPGFEHLQDETTFIIGGPDNLGAVGLPPVQEE